MGCGAGSKTAMLSRFVTLSVSLTLAYHHRSNYPSCGEPVGVYDDTCAPTDVAGNAQLSWLFEAQDIILPGPYLVTTNTSYNRIYSDQVGSAARSIAQQHGKPWAPYLMAKYERNTYRPLSPANTGQCAEAAGDYVYDCYLSEADLRVELEAPARLGASAAIMYCGEADAHNLSSCDAFHKCFEETLGPTIRDVVREQNSAVEQ